MSTFSPAVLGQTEKALNAILDRQLAGAVTERQWVTLVLASGDASDLDELTGRVAGGLKVGDADARELIDALAAAGFVHVAGSVTLTDAGRKLFDDTRVAVAEITNRMWGDLPAEDLDAAGRVLSTVLERANAELAG